MFVGRRRRAVRVGSLCLCLSLLVGCAHHVATDSWLGNRHFDEYRLIGTHNSYHIEPLPAVRQLLLTDNGDLQAANFVKDVTYTHLSLTAQLDLGVRQIELDIYIDRHGGAFAHPAAVRAIEAAGGHLDLTPENALLMQRPGFKVMHDPDADWGSTCLTLDVCLSQVQAWSALHPSHFPIVINLDLKSASGHAVAGQLPSMVEAFDDQSVNELERSIRSRIDTERLMFPDTIRAAFASPRARIIAKGWPRLATMRGKIMFVLTNDALAAAYRVPDPMLKGRLFFPIGPADQPGSLFIERLDPAAADIGALVCAGYIVQTTADYRVQSSMHDKEAGRDRAFRSGAVGISTNYVVPDMRSSTYSVRFANSRLVERVRERSARCGTRAARTLQHSSGN